MCVNTRGGFSCECDSGYEMFEDAQRCVDIDECARRIHDCSHACVNSPGSFYCECPSGLLLADDFQTCVEDTNKMELRNAPEDQVYFVDLMTVGHDAHCPDGYTSTSNGRCEDVDECASLEEHCTADQQCLNTHGAYVCLPSACPEDFIEKDDGSCLERCNATAQSTCANGGSIANTVTYALIDVDSSRFSSDTPIHKLVGYDENGRALPETSFHLQYNPANNHIFHLEQRKRGMALVFAHELQEERIYKLVVFGRTTGLQGRDGKTGDDQLLYLHKFILYLYRCPSRLA